MKLIIANWKMNPQKENEALRLFDSVSKAVLKLKNINLIFCPPFVWLDSISQKFRGFKGKNIFLGAQDIFWVNPPVGGPPAGGAFTGEISAGMLKSLGCKYVIVGHSERRWIIGETNQIINKKLTAVLNSDLIPILAVGEKNRDQNFLKFLKNQLKESLGDLNSSQIKKIIFAYEPVWAIGTGVPDKPKDTIVAVNFIRKFLAERYNGINVSILYGGSVTSKNAGEFLKNSEIDGALVGGASLDAKEFIKILKIASEI